MDEKTKLADELRQLFKDNGLFDEWQKCGPIFLGFLKSKNICVIVQSTHKIIDGLKNAFAGNLSRVTIEGQVWERQVAPIANDIDAVEGLQHLLAVLPMKGAHRSVIVAAITELEVSRRATTSARTA